MAHNLAPSANCSLDDIDLNALKVRNGQVGFIISSWDSDLQTRWQIFDLSSENREKISRPI